MTTHKVLRPRRRFQSLLWLAVIGMVLLALWLAAGASNADAEARSAEENLASAVRKRAVSNPAMPKQSIEEQKKWDELRSDVAFPWSSVLKIVERSVDPDIVLLEFVPDRKSSAIGLRGEAKDADSLFRYVERLSSQPGALKVVLINQELVGNGRPENLSFEIRVLIAATLNER